MFKVGDNVVTREDIPIYGGYSSVVLPRYNYVVIEINDLNVFTLNGEMFSIVDHGVRLSIGKFMMTDFCLNKVETLKEILNEN